MDRRSKDHPCPRCGAMMTLARMTPQLGPFPELHSFRCESCGEVVTVENERSHRSHRYAEARRFLEAQPDRDQEG